MIHLTDERKEKQVIYKQAKHKIQIHPNINAT